MCTYVDLQDVEGKQEDTGLPNSHEGRDQISNNGKNKELTSGLSSHNETSEGDVRCSMCKGTGALMSSHIMPLEGASNQLEANRLVELLCVCYLSERKMRVNDKIFFFFFLVSGLSHYFQ